MKHEPECPFVRDYDEFEQYVPGDCICVFLRAAYQRGTAGAAVIAQARHDDMMWCSKPDDCHAIARGAHFAAEDIKYEIEKQTTHGESATRRDQDT